jgi:predicted Ser/Thr protein kinase
MDPTVAREASLEFTQIPGYRIVQFLARGAMGEVYLGIDENLKRSVAIKIISAEFAKNSECLERFVREGRIIAGFRHSNIVIVYASRWEGTPYIVMEYVDGGTLADRIGQGPLSEKQAIRIAERMADALAYAHAADVIHRDFKPGNILMKENGIPVLSDFGIAKSLDTTGLKTEFGSVFGSLRYMAPEQARDSSNLTNRADVYSFGLVLYEMLRKDIPKRHPVRDPSEAEDIIRALGRPLGELVARCLNIEPGARPSAAECHSALETLSKEAPSKKPRAARIVLIGAAVLAVVGIVFWGSGSLMPARWAGTGKVATTPAADANGPQVTRQLNNAGRSALLAITLNKVPSSARIFVDNTETQGSQVNLAPGEHQLVALAPHYFGESMRLRLEPGSDIRSVSFALDPTSLPTPSELERFSQLADAKTLTEADLSELADRTFQLVLRAKYLNANGKAEGLSALVGNIDSLRRLGDSRAAVAAFLLDSVHAGHIGRAQVTQSLIDASNEGDAMASLFLAVSFRDSMNLAPSGVMPSDPMFRQYCDRLRLASKQGWDDVAAEYMQRDHCSGAAAR